VRSPIAIGDLSWIRRKLSIIIAVPRLALASKLMHLPTVILREYVLPFVGPGHHLMLSLVSHEWRKEVARKVDAAGWSAQTDLQNVGASMHASPPRNA